MKLKVWAGELTREFEEERLRYRIISNSHELDVERWESRGTRGIAQIETGEWVTLATFAPGTWQLIECSYDEINKSDPGKIDS